MKEDLSWSTEQILGFAPDHHVAKSGRNLAKPTSWRDLGQSDSLIWGTHPIVKNREVVTGIDIRYPAFSCTCSAKKSPCKHAIGLFLLWHTAPGAFENTTPPEQLLKQRSAWEKSAKRSTRPTRSRNEQDLDPLLEGMADLALWLEDSFNIGIGRLDQRPKESWDQLSNRLVNINAIVTAEKLRQLAKLHKTKPEGWSDQIIRTFGSIYLMTQGFARFSELDPALQTDLLSAVGRLPRRYDGEVVRDRWLVIGRRTQQIGRQFLYRTWLLGQQSGRFACVARSGHQRAGGKTLFSTGSVWLGAVHFAPSRAPLFAEMDGDATLIDTEASYLMPKGSLIEAHHTYRQIISNRPWVGHTPAALRHARLIRANNQWVVTDPSNRFWQVANNAPATWQMLAIGAGETTPLFGEWDGSRFLPLSLYTDQRWIDCHTLGGVSL